MSSKEDYIIKPESVSPSNDTSQWPLLLKIMINY